MYSLTILGLSLLTLIATSVIKKKLTLFENLYIVLVLEFLVTSYGSILYVNTKRWSVSQDVESLLSFILFETILIPFFLLWYFNFFFSVTTVLQRIGLSLIVVSTLYSIEYFLIYNEAITYEDWSFLYSLLSYTFILLLTLLITVPFIRLLQKEEINK
ncbi:hypothetical protein [Fredinandcohnia sp. 179-A 10B2 NHS]|uniref:hypothetical protein n=1 Tax=Fredinandcohnia sp. 179-A 10B2 NHS TaxID=3235176 RepID=UPI00399FC776